jgi:hypothetical protein
MGYPFLGKELQILNCKLCWEIGRFPASLIARQVLKNKFLLGSNKVTGYGK